MAQMASLHEQRGNFAAALPLRREQMALARAGKREAAATDAQLIVAELLAGTGQTAAAREAFDAGLAELRKASTPRPDLARQWWAAANRHLGMRTGDARAGPALEAFAAHAAYEVLSSHGYGNPALDQVKWDGLSFRLAAWPPATPPTIPTPDRVTAPAGPALLEGGLSELRTAADPPPGMYLLSLSIPRREKRTLRAAMWIYVSRWKLSLHSLETPADSLAENKWIELFAGDSLERRTEPALAFDRVGMLNRGFGPSGRVDGFALSAVTRMKLHAGEYSLRVITDARASAFLDDSKVFDTSTQNNDWPYIVVPENDPGDELKVLAGGRRHGSSSRSSRWGRSPSG